MKLGNKTITALILLSWLLIGTLGYSIRNGYIGHKDPSPRANVYYFFETSKGSYGGRGGNVITNIGEQYVRNAIGFNNVTNFNYTGWISLGNATVSASLTKLTTEATTDGADRKAGTVTTWMNGTDYAYNVTNEFNLSGTIRLGESGLHWNDTDNSDNNMFACDDFTDTTFESGDNLTITWVITWDAN